MLDDRDEKRISSFVSLRNVLNRVTQFVNCISANKRWRMRAPSCVYSLANVEECKTRGKKKHNKGMRTLAAHVSNAHRVQKTYALLTLISWIE